MKKIFFPLLLLLPFLMNAQLEKMLKKTIELKMPLTTDDEMPGTRGAAVAWHPIQKKYYAAFAGNLGFPLAVFNEAGKRLSDDLLTTMVDMRGMWYNPKWKSLYGNAYNTIGWYSYTLDVSGIPSKSEIIASGMNQPEVNSIGVYNPVSNQVCFLSGQRIYMYKEDAFLDEGSTLRLHVGISKKENIDEDDDGEFISDDYSGNVLMYTGISNAEFGILNIVNKQVELYSKTTGLMTQVLKLPEEVETYSLFNFSYTNGTYWAFNQETRTWTGYK